MPSSETSLIVEDGNAVFHCLREVQRNFKQIGHKMLDMVLKNTNVVLVQICITQNQLRPLSGDGVDVQKS